MHSFLRRMLYEVPPAKFAKTKQRLRTLPACKAKAALIDIYSQMAQPDAEFAELVAPHPPRVHGQSRQVRTPRLHRRAYANFAMLPYARHCPN